MPFKATFIFLKHRLFAAFAATSLARIVLYTLAWTAASAFAFITGFYLNNAWFDQGMWAQLYLSAAGGLFAMPIALLLSHMIAANLEVSQRFATHFVLLAIGTIGFQALIFGLLQKTYFWPWLDPILTPKGIIKTAFSLAASALQFAGFGLRHSIPLGPVFLLISAVIFTLKTGQRRKLQ